MTSTQQRSAPTGALDKREAMRLSTLEQRIASGLRTFLEVGAALAEIRDNRLYREQSGTFEAYCRERWRMGRRHAYQLIDAAVIVENVRNLRTLGLGRDLCRAAFTDERSSGPAAEKIGPCAATRGLAACR
jgi:hypothetical protein